MPVSDDKQAWLRKLGVTQMLAGAPSDAIDTSGAVGDGGGTGREVAAAGSAGAADALPATDVDLFFALDSADLTSGDTAALDAYAQSVLAAGSTAPIKVTGYASSDGPKRHNLDLSTARAKAVIDYLAGKGVPAGQLGKPDGQGPTDHFSRDDPRQNRRVVIDPKAPASATPAAPAPDAPPAKPADPPSPKELQERHTLPKQPDIPLPAKDEKQHPHAGVDAQVGFPWSLQATLVLKDFDIKKYGDPKKLSIDLFHEPNLSLTLDPKSGLTAQEMIALLNLHWIPPWKAEIEVPLNLFFNQALSSDPGHLSGGAQVQVEQHVTGWFSVTANVTGTIDSGKIEGAAGAALLFHWDPNAK